MKCNQCGTTIPEGSKLCNGCGKKVEVKSNEEIILEDEIEEEIIDEEVESEVIAEKDENSEEDFSIKDKNAIDSYAYSIMGFMIPIIGFIFIVLALNKASIIKDSKEKEKARTLAKIAIVANIIMSIVIL